MSALSPPCPLWWIHSCYGLNFFGMLELYQNVGIVSECCEQDLWNSWNPLPSTCLSTFVLFCAFTSSLRWFTPLSSSSPCKSIHSTNTPPLICILILLPLFSLPSLSSDFNSFLLCLLTPSCQKNKKENYGERIGANSFSPDSKVPFFMHSVCFTQVGDPNVLASDVVLTEPVQNIREFTVKSGEENVIFAVKQSPPQTSDYLK